MAFAEDPERRRNLDIGRMRRRIRAYPGACGENLAEVAQAHIALNVAIVVVEQLEMIDIDDEDRERLRQFGGKAPFGRQARVEDAAVGNSRQTVDLGQLAQLAIAV